MSMGVVNPSEFLAEFARLNPDFKGITPRIEDSRTGESNLKQDENKEPENKEPEEVIIPEVRDIYGEPITSAEIKDAAKLGRPEGSKEVPDSLRILIGQNALQEGRSSTQVLTRALGISDSSLSAYSVGATSCATYDKPTESLSAYLNQSKAKITKRASNKLLNALKEITADKLEGAKPKDLSGIARDMSIVIKNMEPEGPSAQSQKNFVIFAPNFKVEEQYETIDVAE